MYARIRTQWAANIIRLVLISLNNSPFQVNLHRINPPKVVFLFSLFTPRTSEFRFSYTSRIGDSLWNFCRKCPESRNQSYFIFYLHFHRIALTEMLIKLAIRNFAGIPAFLGEYLYNLMKSFTTYSFICKVCTCYTRK